MIVFLLTGAHRYTIDTLLQSWGRPLRGRLRALPYERFLEGGRFPAATYVFADLERVGLPDAIRLADLHRQLTEAGLRVLNHPTRVRRRYELLRLLHARGINPFNACRLSERAAPTRYPVFIRTEAEHGGAGSDLIRTDVEFARVAAALAEADHPRDDQLVVEFCDTRGADGRYRKYGAFRVGGTIVPRHLFAGAGWQIRNVDAVDANLVAEEMAFLLRNPHARDLAPLFDLARVEYGRIDYAWHDGKPVVWEINTNPMIASPAAERDARRQRAHDFFATRMIEILRAIDAPPGPSVRIVPPRPPDVRFGAPLTLLDRAGQLVLKVVPLARERRQRWRRRVENLLRRKPRG